MFDETQSPSPNHALVALAPLDPDWQPIFQASNQVVLYNPTSHALSICKSSTILEGHQPSSCPYCHRPLPSGFDHLDTDDVEDIDSSRHSHPAFHSRASNYFQLLAIANETSSRPSSPPPLMDDESRRRRPTFPREAMAEGYFRAFFQEEYSVLMQWAEGGSLDDFIDLRLGRSTRLPHIHAHASSISGPSSPSPSTPPASDLHSPSARIRAFRAMKRAPPEERERLRREMEGGIGVGGVGIDGGRGRTSLKAVHLLSPEEVKSLFADVTEGLAFLHDRSILHLDLKPGNVLLTWDEGKLIPRAMLSDFGTSRDMLHSNRNRSGNTGTLEYASPESLPSPQTGLLQQVDSKSDMWSLGMILHKLLFFKLPYQYAADGEASVVDESDKMSKLEMEVFDYRGFRQSPSLVTSFESRRLPRAFLYLLESLLNVTPSSRPSCERVLGAMREGRFDPVTPVPNQASSSLIPVVRKMSDERQGPSSPTYDGELVNSPSNGHYTERGDEGGAAKSENDQWSASLALMEQDGEKTPLLRLAAPPSVPSLEPLPRRRVWRWVGEGWNAVKGVMDMQPELGMRGRRLGIRPSADMYVRGMKSCVLAAKAISISCFSPRMVREYPATVGVLMSLGVADTLLDGLGVSILLAAVHVAAVWWVGVHGE
ncbi:hypothetical protein SERLADRAFT_412726 [Serpula lacrymans var. lacrymans S7.9]|nr:uncharacterized protein SERLADRAFT_412726 [Serpula lacrymans var. lacrymans S7.9]EGO29082.1 hypothetical protein SERLADRAFT_412726 [Serpula lacrymans var. lacrymans S7.9]